MFVYEIWWSKNQLLLQDLVIIATQVAHQVKLVWIDHKIILEETCTRVLLRPHIDQEKKMGLLQWSKSRKS